MTLSPRRTAGGRSIIRDVRTCVIFNPAARGNKARCFRQQLDARSGRSAFKATSAPGDARRLAAEAVAEGFELIVAAGGDGTVNEVINGLADAPVGQVRARLGVLPLGTVNVFARELRLPLRLERAWEVLQGGRERRIDLACADFYANNVRERRHFVQLAGAGFDARAIELLDWPLKKRIGALAYVVAGLKAMRETQPGITVTANGQRATGQWVLIGNGRLYAGPINVFPAADLADGRLDICVVPRMDWSTLLRCAPGLLVRRQLPPSVVRRLQAATVELTSETSGSLEVDGEWAGRLPATLSTEPQGLSVMVP